MNIIFIGAHPDDLEFLAGGTISRCASLGHTVWMATATNGNVGSPTLGKDEIAAVRKKEVTKAASALGAAGLIWLDEDDEFLFDDRRTRLLFVDAIRQAQADVVITHNPLDYHPDHNACSKLATDARILSAVRLIETEHRHLECVPELFYMDSIAGVNFEPEFFADITASYENKMAALACHESQNSWIKAIFDQELADMARIQSAFRGFQAGVTYAESFRQPCYWPKKAVDLPFLSGKTIGL